MSRQGEITVGPHTPLSLRLRRRLCSHAATSNKDDFFTPTFVFVIPGNRGQVIGRKLFTLNNV